MNIRGFLGAVFSGNAMTQEVAAARAAGRSDGRMLGEAYADDFMLGVNESLQDRLKSFKALEVQPAGTAVLDAPRLDVETVEAPKARPRRAAK